MFALVNRGQLDKITENELDNFNSRMKGLWLTEHNEDGTHRVAVLGPEVAPFVKGLDASAITTGTFNAARIPSLDASKITTGTLTDARLSTNVALLNALNIFSVNQQVNAGVGINVAPGATGTLSLSDGIFERSRTTKMGEWISVTYNASNFTASTGTWTVESGDQIVFKYTLIGKTMIVSIELFGTSLSASPASLNIAIPGGFTAKVNTRNACQMIDAGTGIGGFLNVAAGGTVIQAFKDFNAGVWTGPTTNTTSVFGQITFEIQ